MPQLPVDGAQLQPRRRAPIEYFAHGKRVGRAKEIVPAVVRRQRLQNGVRAVLMCPVTGEHGEPIEHARGVAVELERHDGVVCGNTIAEDALR